jgi:peptide/nickel transport system substrate-binding protein
MNSGGKKDMTEPQACGAKRPIVPGRRDLIVGGLVLPMALGASATSAVEPTRLITAIPEDPPVMNPAITSVISAYTTGCPVYSALTNITPANVIEPDLAESWDVSADGRTYTFHLRKGVIWHDGHPFSAADVKFSIENANGRLHPWGRGAYGALDRIETPDELTAVFRLKQPSPALMMASDSQISCILPKHLWEGSDILKNPLNQKPVGTGPYKMVE